MIRVGVAGAAGKMGQTVCDAVSDADDMELVGRADPELDISVGEVVGDIDVLVDFTRPDAVLANCQTALTAGVHVVIGTTGFDLDQLRKICSGQSANVIAAPNFAIGAVLMMTFAAQAARQMKSAEIVEFHNPAKIDSPSGTAKRTAELIENSGGFTPPIHSLRLPGVVASQEVIFGDLAQTLTIRHDTTDRRSFMPGVLLAIKSVSQLTESPVIGLESFLLLTADLSLAP
jgi:4-hydroxy-tetrahydrodipicolinate reductase